jgi:uncharacterized protein (TIGR02058 family)
VTMAFNPFAIEIGLGIDLHGQDPTKAAVKAVRNAVEHVSLPGMRRIAGITDLNTQVFVEILLGVPAEFAGRVDLEQVKEALPFGQRTVKVVPGGLLASSGIAVPSMGDTSDQAVAVVAAVTVSLDVP